MKLPTAHADPSGRYGALVVFGAAVVALLVAFGVPITDAQAVAILGVVAAGAPGVAAFLIRRKAWAPTSVPASVRKAAEQQPPGGP